MRRVQTKIYGALAWFMATPVEQREVSILLKGLPFITLVVTFVMLWRMTAELIMAARLRIVRHHDPVTSAACAVMLAVLLFLRVPERALAIETMHADLKSQLGMLFTIIAALWLGVRMLFVLPIPDDVASMIVSFVLLMWFVADLLGTAWIVRTYRKNV